MTGKGADDDDRHRRPGRAADQSNAVMCRASHVGTESESARQRKHLKR
jgi:hypothetical protein